MGLTVVFDSWFKLCLANSILICLDSYTYEVLVQWWNYIKVDHKDSRAFNFSIIYCYEIIASSMRVPTSDQKPRDGELHLKRKHAHVRSSPRSWQDCSYKGWCINEYPAIYLKSLTRVQLGGKSKRPVNTWNIMKILGNILCRLLQVTSWLPTAVVRYKIRKSDHNSQI